MAKGFGGLGKGVARGLMGTAVWVYGRSGGKVGGRMLGVAVLLLTTTGRKSRRSWTVPVMYQTDGDRWVIIASNGAKATHPAWWLNLRSRPEGSAQIGR